MSIWQSSRDHPRLRGEKLLFYGFCRCCPGSPPLTRGKGLCRSGFTFSTGITPAYAGKSYSFVCLFVCAWDHPRLRGEKTVLLMDSEDTVGSPPLTRGKGTCSSTISCFLRITPAYAGKRSYPYNKQIALKDHPRLRGEKRLLSMQAPACGGSPPLTRGKEQRRLSGLSPIGITPAYAGKSSQLVESKASVEDHPRLRGEKIIYMYSITPTDGSPPLTRGKGS